ncbi:MAG TPA: hypothetical protein VME92_03270 [Acetobacteraceae bacterium]|nr:hypothetical protein [Acetobacteraceae bacterium]
MHFTVLRMLSGTSLSAFSSANATGAAQRPAAIQQVRALSGSDGQTGSAKAGAGGLKSLPAPSDPSTLRLMPRGSLLDLSV